MRPTHGVITMAGRRVNGATPDRLARAGVCTVPEGRGVFPNLTVRENLEMMTFGGRSFDTIEEEAFAHFPRLADRGSQLAGTLSGGEQQMLALARGLATRPALLLLDELSMGLAPLIVDEIYSVVADIASTGVSLLIVEQFARTVLGVADTVAIMLQGRIVEVGPPAELEGKLSGAYLGDRGSGSTSTRLTGPGRTTGTKET
jgi:branched-chain amino acid transport system ATP-binding protein